MKTMIMSLFTRTPLHVGAGNSVGAIDSPVMRERHTRIPVIPGSALKGVIAGLWGEYDENGKVKPRGEEAKKLFGCEDSKNASAGALLIGEARVLAFPVRSAKGAFAWITCPLALRRYQRDAGVPLDVDAIDGLTDDQAIAVSDAVQLDGKVVLEEYCFHCFAKDITAVAEQLANCSSDPVWQQITGRLVIVSDEIFSYFVEQACEVVTRIRIDQETGTVASGALFNQEQVPSETMFYTTVSVFKDSQCLDLLVDKIKAGRDVLQVGGDETIGLGYCSVNFITAEEK